MMIFDSVKWI